MDTSDMNFDIEKIHDASHATQESALLKKDVVAVASVLHVDAAGDLLSRLTLAKLNGDQFQVVVPAGVTLGTVAPQILQAGGYASLLELKLVMPGGDAIGEDDTLPGDV